VVIDCASLFESEVKEYLVQEYINGRTPNPCIVCNEKVKFRAMYDYAMAHGFDKIATGHYANIVKEEREGDITYSIALGADGKKDQSYMLYRLPREILEATVFPLCEAEKTDVRQEGCSLGINLEEKKESQEICFLPNGDYSAFIENEKGICPEGDFINENGEVLGRHRGIIRYTVGQRKGLGISLGERAFVTGIDAKSNTVTLSTKALACEKIIVKDLVYSGITPKDMSDKKRFFVKVRYLAEPTLCTVTVTGECVVAVLDEPVNSVAKGQSAVFYTDDGRVAFGGFIDSVNR
jgi:tRNA-specific 2-thiouridylase